MIDYKTTKQTHIVIPCCLICFHSDCEMNRNECTKLCSQWPFQSVFHQNLYPLNAVVKLLPHRYGKTIVCLV